MVVVGLGCDASERGSPVPRIGDRGGGGFFPKLNSFPTYMTLIDELSRCFMLFGILSGRPCTCVAATGVVIVVVVDITCHVLLCHGKGKSLQGKQKSKILSKGMVGLSGMNRKRDMGSANATHACLLV